MSLSLQEMDNGSWVVFELPGFASANVGSQQSSLEALKGATETSYFKDANALWVKLVVGNAGTAAAGPGCPVAAGPGGPPGGPGPAPGGPPGGGGPGGPGDGGPAQANRIDVMR